MKKFTLLSHTRARTFLNLLPSLAIMTLAIIFNRYADGPVKLWPLIIFMGGITVFLALFLLRVLYLSVEEMRMFGPFTSRDRAVIKKDTSIVMTVREDGKVKIELMDDKGGAPVFDWMKESATADVCLMRETVWGGIGAIERVLKFYGVENEEIERLISEKSYEKTLDSFIISCKRGEDTREVKISFTATL